MPAVPGSHSAAATSIRHGMTTASRIRGRSPRVLRQQSQPIAQRGGVRRMPAQAAWALGHPHQRCAQHRGSGGLTGASPSIDVPDNFVPALAEAAVFWQLLSRDLARHGGPFVGLPERPVRRQLGDIAASGKGELMLTL